MVTVRSVKEYQKLMNKRSRRLKIAKTRSSSQAASFMQATARKLAPRYTGETIRGIKKVKTKTGYQVISRVSAKGLKGFRQNMWANRTFPHRSVAMRWAKPRGRRVIYGDGSHKRSGTPRFFHLATLRTRKKFQRLALQNTRKALRVSV